MERSGRPAGLEPAHPDLLHPVTAGVHLAQLPHDLDGLVVDVVGCVDILGVLGCSDHERLDGRPQGDDRRRGLGVDVQVDPVVDTNDSGREELDLARRQDHEVQRADHGHVLARDGPGPDLFAEDEVRNWELNCVPGTVDARLVNQGILGLGGQHLPLLLVHADVRIRPHRNQGDEHVQLGVGPGKVVDLRHHRLFRKS